MFAFQFSEYARTKEQVQRMAHNISNEVLDLIKEYSYLSVVENSSKVHCSLTTHDIPARLADVNCHLKSKKLKKLLEWYNQDFDKYGPHIVPDKRNKKKLFCRLTKVSLNRIPEEVERHVNGKKFMRLKAEKEERQAAYGSRKKSSGEGDDSEKVNTEIWNYQEPDAGSGDGGEMEGAESDGEVDDADNGLDEGFYGSDIEGDGEDVEADGDDQDEWEEEGDDEEAVEEAPKKVKKSANAAASNKQSGKKRSRGDSRTKSTSTNKKNKKAKKQTV